MPSVPFLVYNAFTNKPFGGNPAGIVPAADDLPLAVMQNIARQLNLVETVFVLALNREKASCRLRYFTPFEELPVAGHPTIAAMTALRAEGFLPKATTAHVQSRAGIHRIVFEPPAVRMEQIEVPVHRAACSRADAAAACGLEESDLDPALPVKVANAGLGHVIVPVKSLAALMKAENNIPLTKKVVEACGVREMQVFCRKAHAKDCAFHTRNFVPYVSTEDPACGNGNAALGAYIYEQIPEFSDKLLRIEQGWATERPAVIEVSHYERKIYIGGQAVKMAEGKIEY